MLSGLFDVVLLVVHDKRLLISLLVAVLAAGTIVMFAMPYLTGDNLSRRMNAVGAERAKIRTRERERAAHGDGIALKKTPTAAVQNLVEGLDLKRWLGTDSARSNLVLAGYPTRRRWGRSCFSGWSRRSRLGSFRSSMCFSS